MTDLTAGQVSNFKGTDVLLEKCPMKQKRFSETEDTTDALIRSCPIFTSLQVSSSTLKNET